MAETDAQDEIWLNHLRPNEHKWLALVGEYPYRLVAVGDDAVEAVATAKVAGFDEVTLFKVPPFHPMCVTPFLTPKVSEVE